VYSLKSYNRILQAVYGDSQGGMDIGIVHLRFHPRGVYGHPQLRFTISVATRLETHRPNGPYRYSPGLLSDLVISIVFRFSRPRRVGSGPWLDRTDEAHGW
jgi:hypothetical protein